MYEELIKALRDKADFLSKTDYDRNATNSFADAMRQAADAIEELSHEIDIDNAAIIAMDAAMPRWIPVTERLPEKSEGLNWHEDMIIRFTSVWCCDAKTGTIEVRNRLQGKMTGNEYLDKYTKDTNWRWSKSWWEPTHWMPIVPLPTPPKEET